MALLYVDTTTRTGLHSFIFLPAYSTHLTQPLDVGVFAPMKKQWRVELNKYKEYCISHNIRNVTIPKERFGGLLKDMLNNNKVNNSNNIRYQYLRWRGYLYHYYRMFAYNFDTYLNFVLLLLGSTVPYKVLYSTVCTYIQSYGTYRYNQTFRLEILPKCCGTGT